MINDKDRARIAQLYNAGYSQKEISMMTGYCQTTVHHVLIYAGSVKSRNTNSHDDKIMDYCTLKDNIEYLRNNTRVGDKVIVKTYKSTTSKVGFVTSAGVLKPATVVSVTHPKFCMVQLESGALDSISWHDLYLANRGYVEDEEDNI